VTSGEVWARWNHKDPEPRPVYDWERSSLSFPYGSYNLELSPKTKSGGIPEGGLGDRTFGYQRLGGRVFHVEISGQAGGEQNFPIFWAHEVGAVSQAYTPLRYPPTLCWPSLPSQIIP